MKPLAELTEQEIRAMETGAGFDAYVAEALGCPTLRSRDRCDCAGAWHRQPYSTDPGEAFGALRAWAYADRAVRGFVMSDNSVGAQWSDGKGNWQIQHSRTRPGDGDALTVEARDIAIVILLAARGGKP